MMPIKINWHHRKVLTLQYRINWYHRELIDWQHPINWYHGLWSPPGPPAEGDLRWSLSLDPPSGHPQAAPSLAAELSAPPDVPVRTVEQEKQAHLGVAGPEAENGATRGTKGCKAGIRKRQPAAPAPGTKPACRTPCRTLPQEELVEHQRLARTVPGHPRADIVASESRPPASTAPARQNHEATMTQT